MMTVAMIMTNTMLDLMMAIMMAMMTKAMMMMMTLLGRTTSSLGAAPSLQGPARVLETAAKELGMAGV